MKATIREILLFSIIMAVFLLVFGALETFFPLFKKWIPWVALTFLIVGLLIYFKFHKPKPVKQNLNVETASEYVHEANITIEQEVLSSREYEVLKLIAQGHSNKEIAERLFVSVNTIKSHIQKIFEKLEVQNRTQAIVKARDIKLI